MEETNVTTNVAAAPATETAVAAPAARKPFKRMNKKKVCQFCVDKAEAIDYKDAQKLKKYVTEKKPYKETSVSTPSSIEAGKKNTPLSGIRPSKE